MAGVDRLIGGGGGRVLSSDWGNLSPNLIAVFYPMKRGPNGSGWLQSRDVRQVSSTDNYSVDDDFEVWCPLSDANQEMSFNWTSPFEGAGAESKAPALEWSVPTYLASEGVIAGAVQNGASQSPLETIYPSMTPQIIGMRYGDGTFSPMVIESISKPLTNPRSEAGVMISCSVQLTLATLTAWDRRDIHASYR